MATTPNPLQESFNLAAAFAQLYANAAQAANAERARAAGATISAGQAQIDLAATKQRREISRSLRTYQSSLAAAAAFRGTGGGGSNAALSTAASMQAGEEAAAVASNAAAQEVALIVSNRPQFEDPTLAALQGGLQGFGIGQQIRSSLDAMTTIRNRSGSQVIGRGALGEDIFQNFTSTFAHTPGFNLAQALQMNLPGFQLG